MISSFEFCFLVILGMVMLYLIVDRICRSFEECTKIESIGEIYEKNFVDISAGIMPKEFKDKEK